MSNSLEPILVVLVGGIMPMLINSRAAIRHPVKGDERPASRYASTQPRTWNTIAQRSLEANDSR